MVPSFPVRDTRRFPCSQAMRRPCRSSVRPFVPICTPSGNSRGKTGLRKTESPPVGVHFMMALDGISLNSRYPLLRSQTGPSANRRLPITFSTAAPAGTSLSNAGSRRWTLPALPDWAASGRTALTHESTESSFRCRTKLMLSPAHAHRLNRNRQSHRRPTYTGRRDPLIVIRRASRLCGAFSPFLRARASKTGCAIASSSVCTTGLQRVGAMRGSVLSDAVRLTLFRCAAGRQME